MVVLVEGYVWVQAGQLQARRGVKETTEKHATGLSVPAYSSWDTNRTLFCHKRKNTMKNCKETGGSGSSKVVQKFAGYMKKEPSAPPLIALSEPLKSYTQ
jgi:hypothetical protein